MDRRSGILAAPDTLEAAMHVLDRVLAELRPVASEIENALVPPPRRLDQLLVQELVDLSVGNLEAALEVWSETPTGAAGVQRFEPGAEE